MPAFELSSTLPIEYLKPLEELMFFNPQQQLAEGGVIQAIERFGTPQITVSGNQLNVTLPQRPDVQSLFAVAAPDGVGELAGMILYLRTDQTNLIVLHVAVTEEYSASGTNGGDLLVMRLFQAVEDCARRLNGVRQITILYSNSVRVVPIARARSRPRTFPASQNSSKHDRSSSEGEAREGRQPGREDQPTLSR
jgi:hypothetical protein